LVESCACAVNKHNPAARKMHPPIKKRFTIMACLSGSRRK